MKQHRLFYLVIILIAFTNYATATNYTWAAAGSGNWTTASNWSPSSGYPGSSGTGDVATINVTGITVTLTSSITIGQLVTATTFGVNNVTVAFSGSPTLTINNGLSIGQPSSATYGIIFSGSGTAIIGGTSTFAYQADMKVLAGATLTFPASSTVDFSTLQSSLDNYGTINFISSTFLLGPSSGFNNYGIIKALNTTLTMSGTPITLNNTATFNTTSCTFNITGGNISITNSGSGVFITDKCTFVGNAANSGVLYSNSATRIDHGSTLNILSNNGAIKNTGTNTFHGSTINIIGTNPALTLTNSGTMTADSGSMITIGSYQSTLTNSGTFYAGTSNSPCTINLSGQSSSLSNTGTFYVGSTSVINPTGTSASISNGTGNQFTLQSDNYGSATISALSSTATISGSFTVQRYLTGGTLQYRGYRLLSSPVNAGSGWYSINYLLSDIWLTATTTSASGGFDNTTPANPTLYLYRENLTPSYTTFLNSNFIAVNNLKNAPTYGMHDAVPYNTTNIFVGDGYLCFFRGSRKTLTYSQATTVTTIPTTATLNATGTINYGQIIVKNWFTPASTKLSFSSSSPVGSQGFNLVGNPYPSSIDWETYQTATSGTGIYAPNVLATIYLLDPKSHNFGAYIKGGNGAGTNNASNIIVSGQGFFVTAQNTSAQLQFNESAKTNTQVVVPKLLMGAPTDEASVQYLRLKLAEDSVNTEDIVVRFKSDATPIYDQNIDAAYKTGQGRVNLASISSDQVDLAINTLPLPKQTPLTIGLNFNVTVDGNYTLNLTDLVGIPKLFDVRLTDGYKKGTSNLKEKNTYSFNVVKGDSTSFGPKRFALVISQSAAYAYRLVGFTATKMPAMQVNLAWKTANEESYVNFTIERSIDNGKTYNFIGSIRGSALGSYSIIDKSPINGLNLYRLKQDGIYSGITYSQVLPVLYAEGVGAANVSVYPNPAGNSINLVIKPQNNEATTYGIKFVNNLGVVVKEITSSQPSWSGSIDGLKTGAYIVTVANNKTQSFIGESKFVKQ